MFAADLPKDNNEVSEISKCNMSAYYSRNPLIRTSIFLISPYPDALRMNGGNVLYSKLDHHAIIEEQ